MEGKQSNDIRKALLNKGVVGGGRGLVCMHHYSHTIILKLLNITYGSNHTGL